jgi:preprotein translocase subunit SecA
MIGEPKNKNRADEWDPRQILTRIAKAHLRRELTDLEQFVLIQIFDNTWKDHLYAMDMLKGSIGLQQFAEQDPRVLFKKEGYEFFQQMMISIRDKVTDLIFRARVMGQTQTRSNYRETAAVHESAGGYGVTENLAATASAVETRRPSGEGEEQPTATKTIVREQPKVGRNDPCPCGSGKKYKKCCGANAA